MKKTRLIFLASLMILSVFTGCNTEPSEEETVQTESTETTAAEVEKEPIRIMTSNIWGDYFGNEVEGREDNLLEVYKRYSPDIIGMQEATESWNRSNLFVSLMRSGYLLLSNTNMSSGANNFTPIFVKEDRFKWISSGFEYLEDTDDRTKSIQWTVLEDKYYGTKIAVCNTHFEYRGGAEYDAAREGNAKQLAALMLKLKEEFGCESSFGMGDMNTTIYSSVFTVYDDNDIQKLADLAPEEPVCSTIHRNPVRGDDGQFHGVRTCSPFKNAIDHIVGTEGTYSVIDYQVVIDEEALDASDHSPVFADIRF